MIDQIIGWDHQVFYWINQVGRAPALDIFFVTITNLHKTLFLKAFVLPLFLVFGFWKYRWVFGKWLIALGITIGITDAFNYRVLKPLAHRSRPAYAQGVDPVVLISKTPGDWSFPSNHAVNSFAGAVILSAVFPAMQWFLFAYAFLVSYSRPYVGVHFPLDVFIGGLLGFCMARILLKQIFYRFAWWQMQRPSQET